MALIPLNTFKTKTAILNTESYDKVKCSRDTGLIIDSIAFDILLTVRLSQHLQVCNIGHKVLQKFQVKHYKHYQHLIMQKLLRKW